MRGKGRTSQLWDTDQRITPAYAGKSLWRLLLPRLPTDHPRLCGEKPFSGDLHQKLLGSPPPMRGKGHGTGTV